MQAILLAACRFDNSPVRTRRRTSLHSSMFVYTLDYLAEG